MNINISNLKKSGFTFVELIVVTTIIIILGAIGFISYTGFISKARDSNRISQIKDISQALESYIIKGKLPLPDDRVTLYSSGTIIGYQGYAGDYVLDKIGVKEGGKDPIDDKYYTYYLDVKLRNTQLMAFLENDTVDDSQSIAYKNIIINKANAVDYTTRIPTTYGTKLGILLDSNNSPIQENISLRTSGLDILKTNTIYTSYYNKNTKITGTGIVLGQINPTFSCKRILETGSAKGDGVYTINPIGVDFQVYCDMSNDSGGWTLVMKNDGNSDSGSLSNNANTGYGYNITNLSTISYDNAGLFNDSLIKLLLTRQFRIEGVNGEKIYGKLYSGDLYGAKTLSSKYRGKIYSDKDFYTDTSIKCVGTGFNYGFGVYDNACGTNNRGIVPDLNPGNSGRYGGWDAGEYLNSGATSQVDGLFVRVFVK